MSYRAISQQSFSAQDEQSMTFLSLCNKHFTVTDGILAVK